MNNSKTRVALLITNIEFKDKGMNRRGAEKDEENMETLLTALGYLVIKHRNLTGKVFVMKKKKQKKQQQHIFN